MNEAPEARAEAHRRRLAAAKKYQPQRIKLLLVAEAPPADLERYFYFEGPESADPLFESVCYVLFEAKPAGEKAPYLGALRRRGVCLIELEPGPSGEAKHAESARWLPLRVETYAPGAIVCIGEAVFRAARDELTRAGLPLVPQAVPSPGGADATAFARDFRRALIKGGLERLIRPLRKA